MYAALWRILPGPWFVRVLILVVAVAIVVTLLVIFVFPPFDQFIAPRDVTVEKS